MKKCKECGGEFRSKNYNAHFCGASCRRTFNNRRATRGAILYDLVMIGEFDVENRHQVQDRIPALLDQFRAEDQAAGRKSSWKLATEVHMDTVALAAKVV